MSNEQENQISFLLGRKGVLRLHSTTGMHIDQFGPFPVLNFVQELPMFLSRFEQKLHGRSDIQADRGTCLKRLRIWFRSSIYTISEVSETSFWSLQTFWQNEQNPNRFRHSARVAHLSWLSIVKKLDCRKNLIEKYKSKKFGL